MGRWENSKSAELDQGGTLKTNLEWNYPTPPVGIKRNTLEIPEMLRVLYDEIGIPYFMPLN